MTAATPAATTFYRGSVMCAAGDQPHPIINRRGYRCALCGGWLREKKVVSNG